MELKRPVQTGTTSRMGNDLQHEAAMRVQARLDADEALRRKLAKEKAIRSGLSVAAMLLALGGGFWAWRSGLLDSSLDKQPQPAPQTAAAPAAPVTTPAAPAVKPLPAAKTAPAAPVENLHAQALARFAGASFDYWKNAVAADKPGKDQARTFTGLVPAAAGGFTLLEIEMGGGRPLTVRRIGSDNAVAELPRSEFAKLIAKTPYLVVREGRAYFCSAGESSGAGFHKVPAKGAAFDPARAELGALADCLKTAKVQAPKAKYKVTLVIEKLKKELPVATVGYGETVPRTAFEKAARTLLDDAGMCETFLAAGKVRVAAAK